MLSPALKVFEGNPETTTVYGQGLEKMYSLSLYLKSTDRDAKPTTIYKHEIWCVETAAADLLGRYSFKRSASLFSPKTSLYLS